MIQHPHLTIALLLGLSLATGGCSGSGDSARADGGSEDAGSESSSATDSPSAPLDSGGGSSSGGSSSGGGGSGDAGLDLSKLHSTCPKSGPCPAGLTAVTYSGFGGPSGPQLCSCEIPCGEDASTCPTGTRCSYVADGPGYVCE